MSGNWAIMRMEEKQMVARIFNGIFYFIAGGKSGLHGGECWLITRWCEPMESNAEIKPPPSGKGEKVG